MLTMPKSWPTGRHFKYLAIYKMSNIPIPLNCRHPSYQVIKIVDFVTLLTNLLNLLRFRVLRPKPCNKMLLLLNFRHLSNILFNLPT